MVQREKAQRSQRVIVRSLNPSSSTKPASFEVPVSKTRCRYRFALRCFRVRTCTAWCSEIGFLMSLVHAIQVHPLTSENQFHCTRLYSCRSVRLQRRDSEEKQSSVTFPVLVTEA